MNEENYGHLVLSRRIGERLIISKDNKKVMVITLTKILSGLASFSISAPLDYEIDREELYIKKMNERIGEEDNYGNHEV